jgi:hypothetical protein
MTIAKRLAVKEKMTPKQGFDLVGLDDFEVEPEDELYFIEHFETQKEAEAAQKARKEDDPDEVTYVFGRDYKFPEAADAGAGQKSVPATLVRDEGLAPLISTMREVLSDD